MGLGGVSFIVFSGSCGDDEELFKVWKLLNKRCRDQNDNDFN